MPTSIKPKPKATAKIKPAELLRNACHEHTADIDRLDGSNFFTVPEYLYPEWLHNLSATTGTPARKLLSECIRYRNSMGFQQRKQSIDKSPQKATKKGLSHANA